MRITAAFLITAMMVALFASCGEKPPETEKVTVTEIHSMIDPFSGNSGAASESDSEETGFSQAGNSDASSASSPAGSVSQTQKENGNVGYKIADVEFVLQNYYSDGTNYGEINNIRFDDESFASSAYGYLDVKLIYLGSARKNLVIGYKAYNARGKVVRDSTVAVKTEGTHTGDTVENIRFNVPFSTVRVEFFDREP